MKEKKLLLGNRKRGVPRYNSTYITLKKLMNDIQRNLFAQAIADKQIIDELEMIKWDKITILKRKTESGTQYKIIGNPSYRHYMNQLSPLSCAIIIYLKIVDGFIVFGKASAPLYEICGGYWFDVYKKTDKTIELVLSIETMNAFDNLVFEINSMLQINQILKDNW